MCWAAACLLLLLLLPVALNQQDLLPFCMLLLHLAPASRTGK
jgi:hypothetical protein